MYFQTIEWNNKIEPMVHDIKFYLIFFNAALNPIIYGYCNETMRKAFRITFTWLFKEKVSSTHIHKSYFGTVAVL